MSQQQREMVNGAARVIRPLIQQLLNAVNPSGDNHSVAQREEIRLDCRNELNVQLAVCKQILPMLSGETEEDAALKELRVQVRRLKKSIKQALATSETPIENTNSFDSASTDDIDVTFAELLELNSAAPAAVSTSSSTQHSSAIQSSTSSSTTARTTHLQNRITLLNERIAQLSIEIDSFRKANPPSHAGLSKSRQYPRPVLVKMSDLAQARSVAQREQFTLQAEATHPHNLPAQINLAAELCRQEIERLTAVEKGATDPLSKAELAGLLEGLRNNIVATRALWQARSKMAQDIVNKLQLRNVTYQRCREHYMAQPTLHATEFENLLQDHYNVSLLTRSTGNNVIYLISEKTDINPQTIILKFCPVNAYIASCNFDYRSLPDDLRLTEVYYIDLRSPDKPQPYDNAIMIEFSEYLPGGDSITTQQEYEQELANDFPENFKLRQARLNAMKANLCAAVAEYIADCDRKKIVFPDCKGRNILVAKRVGPLVWIKISDKKSKLIRQPNNNAVPALEDIGIGNFDVTHADGRVRQSHANSTLQTFIIDKLQKQALGATLVEILQANSLIPRNQAGEIQPDWQSTALQPYVQPYKDLCERLLRGDPKLSLEKASELLKALAEKWQIISDNTPEPRLESAQTTSSTSSHSAARPAADDNDDPPQPGFN